MMKEIILRRLNDLAGEKDLFTDVRFGVRPLPSREPTKEEVPSEEAKVKREDLTIREIAERRLAKWKHEGGD